MPAPETAFPPLGVGGQANDSDSEREAAMVPRMLEVAFGNFPRVGRAVTVDFPKADGAVTVDFPKVDWKVALASLRHKPGSRPKNPERIDWLDPLDKGPQPACS